MPLGKVCVSCETKSQFSCDHKPSLFNKNLLLGNYLIKLFILEYTYGARRLCLIFNKRLALEKKCLTVTFKSPWTCGDGLSVEGEQLENFRTPGITLFCHFFQVWPWWLIETLQSDNVHFMNYVHLSLMWFRQDTTGGYPWLNQSWLAGNLGVGPSDYIPPSFYK